MRTTKVKPALSAKETAAGASLKSLRPAAAHAGSTRASAEPRSGHDFSRLQIHAPGDAHEQQADLAAWHQPFAVTAVERSATGNAPAPPIVEEVLHAPGTPLDSETRVSMERRFEHDFSRVRVHTGARAAESADAIEAAAYTSGQHIVFGAGRYLPGTPPGDRLLAHELTHTLQQGSARNSVQRSLKFEFQTRNFVWAVKSSSKVAPDPLLLPRKYAPTTIGYKEGSGEERGSMPAYLAVGHRGGPVRGEGIGGFRRSGRAPGHGGRPRSRQRQARAIRARLPVQEEG